ncbi:MAG: hypothetical protein IKH34_07040 [Oscillospiraceae bacterium]|nr:hypothetical protein [Oscillospiraceae bacterium]
MKKRLVLLCLLFCLLLSACGSDALDHFEAFSAELNQCETLSYTAALTASYPDRTAQFTLRYALEDGVQRVTVLGPDSISGISARLEAGKSALEYDGLILDTGDLDEFGLTPMSALPLLTDALRRGHADAFWTEEGMDAVELLYDDYTRVRIWFDAEGLPCRCEIQCGDRVTVSCEIKNWSMK